MLKIVLKLVLGLVGLGLATPVLLLLGDWMISTLKLKLPNDEVRSLDVTLVIEVDGTSYDLGREIMCAPKFIGGPPFWGTPVRDGWQIAPRIVGQQLADGSVLRVRFPERVCLGMRGDDLDDAMPGLPVVERFDSFDDPTRATAYTNGPPS